MKPKTILMFVAALALPVVAAVMRPSSIVFGEVRDPYGIRLTSGAEVSAFYGTTEIARTAVNTYPGGATYRLVIDVQDPQTSTPELPVPGDTLELKVKISGVEQPVIGDTTFSVPGNGECVERDLLLGVDSDSDGIPDAWEYMVIANTPGSITNLNQVGPGADSDGDGMEDDEEFWYGSFAFLPGDQLGIDDLSMVEGKYAFRFLTVPDVLYEIQESPELSSPTWARSSVCLDPMATPSAVQFRGTGDYMTIYVVPAHDKRFYRLNCP